MGQTMMFQDGIYNNDSERTRLYWAAWRILARYNRNLSPEDRSALISIKKSFFRNESFDPLIASYVERMSIAMLGTKSYAY